MLCWARYLLIATVVVLGIGQMIAACGQKGDLYLPEPEEKPAQQTSPAATTPTAIEEVPPPTEPKVQEGQ